MQEPSAETEVTENVKVVLHISKGVEQKLVKVPDVTNMPLDEAEALLNENGLELGEVSSDFSSVYEEGYVINQGTVKEAEVLEGTAIDVTVSLGEEESSEVKKGGTITITSPFTKEDEKGNMVVQAYDEQNKAMKIHDTEVSYNLFRTSGGAIKVNYPAGTTKVEVFLDGKLIMSEIVNE